MRRDDALLLDMLIAAPKIQRFTDGLTRVTFHTNELVQSAVLRELQVIGEAARNVTDETKSRLTDIAWAAIAGMRNRIIHEYFRVDVSLVWEAIETDIPALTFQLETAVPQAGDPNSLSAGDDKG